MRNATVKAIVNLHRNFRCFSSLKPWENSVCVGKFAAGRAAYKAATHLATAQCKSDSWTTRAEFKKMSKLAVFDFDRTIVDDDSDATIINKLREKSPPPEFDSSTTDWTPYMSDIFEHAYSSGLSQQDILDAIASMKPTAGMEQLISKLAAAGWDVLILTDANSVFVNHWIKMHKLQDAVTSVITNRAFWQSGRLYIEPYMRQVACPRCPTNLCKSLALAQWCAQRPYSSVIYSGDGRNDYCPATNLPAHAIVFPRRGFPLDDLIKKTSSSSCPQVKAKVVPWDDCYTIIRELFPNDVISN